MNTLFDNKTLRQLPTTPGIFRQNAVHENYYSNVKVTHSAALLSKKKYRDRYENNVVRVGCDKVLSPLVTLLV